MGLRQELSSFYSAIGRPSIAPAARWTGAHGGQAFFAYSTNYLIDVENAIIVDVEPTTAIRQAEVLAAKRMIERTAKNFALHPVQILVDESAHARYLPGG
jgi:hypothetical protein